MRREFGVPGTELSLGGFITLEGHFAFKEMLMRIVRYSVLALLVTVAFTGCKKGGGGGYIRTAPSPAVTK